MRPANAQSKAFIELITCADVSLPWNKMCCLENQPKRGSAQNASIQPTPGLVCVPVPGGHSWLDTRTAGGFGFARSAFTSTCPPTCGSSYKCSFVPPLL